MTTLYYTILASVYGSGAYGSSNYNGTNSTSGLSNTGIAIGLIIGIAALVLLVAIAVRIWKRPARRPKDEA